MAFPTIPTVAAGRVVTGFQADTNATRTFPSLTGLTKNAGDLLIAIIVGYQSSLTSNVYSVWGGGFTEVKDIGVASQMCLGVAYKWSNGSETGAFSVSQNGTVTGHAGFILLSIPGAHATTPPEVAAALATGTTAAADPAALTPAGWGAEDTLWISVGANGETSLTGPYTGMGLAAGPPTNYGDAVSTGESADVIGAIALAVAFRQLNASSENVGPWSSIDTSNARNVASVIAVRPAAASASGTGAPVIDEMTLAASGTVVNPVTGTGAPVIDEMTVAGAGAEGFSGTAALTIDEMTVAGSGAERFTGSAALTIDEMTVAGAGAEGFTGTGALAIDEMTVAGSGTSVGGGPPPVSGTGAPVIDEMTVAASGSEGFTGSAALTIDEMTVAAAGSEGFAGTGTLLVDEAALAAVGGMVVPVTGTGALLADEVVVAASGVVAVPVVGAGALSVDEAQVSGVAYLTVEIPIASDPLSRTKLWVPRHRSGLRAVR